MEYSSRGLPEARRVLARTAMATLLATSFLSLPAAAQDGLDTSEAVTLTISTTPGSSNALFTWAGESFMEKYPNVTLEVVEYETDWYNQNAVRLFNSSDRPDLGFFWLTGFYSALVETGALLPLDDFYKESGLIDVLPESSIQIAVAADGVKYGVPFNSIMSPLLMYNKTAFAEAGIEGEPETMEEFLALAEPLRAAGYIPWTSGLASPSQATQLFDINIRRYTDDETYARLLSKDLMDYTSADMIAAFANMQKMAETLMAPGAAGVADLEARSLFAQEAAAIYSDGSWNLGSSGLGAELPEGFDLGIMSYPLARDDTDRSTGFYDANGIVIAAESPDTEWAKAFVSHILSYDLQSTMGQVISGTPVRNDIPTDVLEVSYDPAVAQIYNRVVSEGTHRIFNTIMPGEYRPAATQLIQGLIGGQLTPEEFAEEFTAMVQSVH